MRTTKKTIYINTVKAICGKLMDILYIREFKMYKILCPVPQENGVTKFD